jgi:pimeloyl-ACP methyl ester carboxylesterase
VIVDAPQTRYARSGEVHVAYQVVGDGPVDVIIVPGYVSHLEVFWENPGVRGLVERLARFARVIAFDKRGTGMSDPVAEVPTLEQRMDDVRAVMDAVDSENAVLFGISEGGPLAVLFAATYPQRARGLVLYGAMARSTWAPDYPWASTADALLEAALEFTAPQWGTGDNLEIFAPSAMDDAAARAWWGRMERLAASPAMMQKIFAMFLDVDVRDVVPLVQCPTLVLHRRGDRVVNIGAGRWLAEHIPGARMVELEGRDHVAWAGDHQAVLGAVEEFVTGRRATPPPETERVLATVMFVDLVGSTERAAAMGDRSWRELLERYYGVVRAGLEQFRGRQVKTIGDGVLASFDGPGRAIRSAESIAGSVQDLGLQARVGLHTGECELLGEDLGGIAVHIAARIVAMAQRGEVLVSSTVKDLVAGSGIGFGDRGTHVLKGVPGEWRLFAVEA